MVTILLVILLLADFQQVADDENGVGDLQTVFPLAAYDLRARLERGEKVLVRCQAGRSRSVSFVVLFAMYLRRCRGLNPVMPNDILKYIAQRRLQQRHHDLNDFRSNSTLAPFPKPNEIFWKFIWLAVAGIEEIGLWFTRICDGNADSGEAEVKMSTPSSGPGATKLRRGCDDVVTTGVIPASVSLVCRDTRNAILALGDRQFSRLADSSAWIDDAVSNVVCADLFSSTAAHFF